MALALNHQTAEQFASRFWERVQQARASGDTQEWRRLIWWIWQRVQDGDLTNNQVRLSFNAAFNRSLTIAQWNSFVTAKLIPIKDRYLAMLAEGDL